jgi:hypothetical protein
MIFDSARIGEREEGRLPLVAYRVKTRRFLLELPIGHGSASCSIRFLLQ